MKKMRKARKLVNYFVNLRSFISTPDFAVDF